ncbi:MAG: cyclodeaminase/cyclohydrolase family protein [Candidatus Thermoplasmatota archaeon]|nr:cyclodeaminase/cyclohydrolase family protein [Candidatus Thermoplasmatota archaeon]
MLNGVESLRDFCAELSSSSPSPGGGTASAAAGAMSASLLAMVCSVTGKKKKSEELRPELDMLTDSLLTLRDELVDLAQEDARAYDGLVEAMRRRRTEGTDDAVEAVKAALGEATEVPQKTARACARILEMATRVGEIGTRNAYSDVAVAVYLAEAGVTGALMNVLINIEGSTDSEHADSTRMDVQDQYERAGRAAKQALDRLSGALR